MANSYELSGLDPYAFENLVNLIALKVLGPGATGFGPGADGGRDGYFEGEAPYPSILDPWKGTWYIQSKFHAPHLSKDPHNWLIEKVKGEIESFNKIGSDRVWPDNWIIATNIDPSGKPETGSFDAIRKLVDAATNKKVNVAVWGGKKILDLLAIHEDVASQYAHFITPGQILVELKNQLEDQHASIQAVVRYLVATQFAEQIYTKLDQAGSSSDTRPGVHHLFIDLPFCIDDSNYEGSALDHLCLASAQPQKHSVTSRYPKTWRDWRSNPQRARVALLKGGPGQGKSTVGQYFSQIQRAALLLQPDAPAVVEKVRAFALEVEQAARKIGAWPSSPRIPIFIELKEYAHWFGQRSSDEGRGVLSYLANRIGAKVEQAVLPGMLRRALQVQSWFVLFDGLDEVPNDVKDSIADEVVSFVNEVVVQEDADVLTLCTSRPQGYSGQFSALDGPILVLQKLSVDTAISCAEPVVRFDRSEDEGTRSLELLKSAAASQSVQQLMTTPLQAHIMAVVVRDGGRPPELRWALFENFYQVMKKRESVKNIHNPRISRLLREDDRLIRAVHARLGFVLHARAERSDGAQTTLTKSEFRTLVLQVVEKLSDDNATNIVDVVMEAMTERLVLVSTPENGAQVRFDIRQLQEFFAAEFLYDAVTPEILAGRIEVVGGDSHWLEVMHFLLSALVENRRTTELDVVVKVLERLNEGNLDGVNRLFYRRMARGAILAMRLLVEGVLEQDKRDRLRFKPLFDPIGGVLDTRILANLRNVRAPNSKAWLINILSEKIAEANLSESIGAIVLLGWLLPNDHRLNCDLWNQFRSLPVQYQQVALDAWCSIDHLRYGLRGEKWLSLWVVVAIVNIAANDEQWSSLNSLNKGYVLSVLVSHFELLPRAFELSGVEPAVSKLMLSVFDAHIGYEESMGVRKDFGPVVVGCFQHNWATGSLPENVLQAWLACKELDPQGMFRVVFSILRFSQNRSFENLQAILKLIPDGCEDVFFGIPNWLAGLIPCRNEHYYLPFDCSHLRTLDCQSFDKLVNEGDLDKLPSIVFKGLGQLGESRGDDVGWRNLFEHLPFIAVHFVLSGDFVHFGVSAEQRKEYLPSAEEVLLKSPRLAKMHFLHWGLLQAENPDCVVKLRALVNKSGVSDTDIVYWDSGLKPFVIDEVDESSVRLLARGIFNSFVFQRDSEWSEMVETLGNTLQRFGVSPDELIRISNDSNLSVEARTASWLLRLICIDSVGVKERLLGAISDESKVGAIFDSGSAGWLLEGLCGLMQKELVEALPGVIAVANSMLVASRVNVELRQPISRMLTVWREASSSPVHSNQSLQKWLDE